VRSIGLSAFTDTALYKNKDNWNNGVLYIDNCLIKAKPDVVPSEYTIKNGTRLIAGLAFNGCKSLTSITIPESVTEIGNFAFDSCSGLTSITIPEGVTKIGKFAFRGCKNLTSITLPKSLLTQIGDEFFDDCNSLTITKTKKSSEPQPNDDLPFN
jgi:hypothetical protein